MTQTQPSKNGPSVGTAAAQAAAGHAAAAPKPAEGAAPKPAEGAAPKPAEGAAGGAGGAVTGASNSDAAAGKKRESKKRVFVVVGEVREFESVNQAEKFLNSPEAPAGEYAVLQGTRTRTSKRVSLR